MVDATESTLGTSEMIAFHISGAWHVGRAYGGRLAHIYFAGLTRSLCWRFVRTQWDDLYPYEAGDATCKGCLRKFRSAPRGAEEE